MPTERFVYLGLLPLAKGNKMTTALVPEEEVSPYPQDQQKVMIFDRKVDKYFSTVGGVYEIEVPEPGTIRASTAAWKGMYKDEVAVAKMQAYATSVRREVEGKNRMKKEQEEHDLFRDLDRIKSAYHNSIGIHRQHLIAAFVEYIVRG